ncbi:hypothetical protein [Halosolutus halophilus]|uniref:hypothetical protein n=1 Tax=Halosolutus halophilus TaxID=1552990 RepID=UPI0022350756|nr:hypothetical protein [Halosolutus halophilus]
MTERSTGPPELGGPVTWIRNVVRRSWNDLLSVYYANTLIWRVFKSGALVFLGLFCWTGANLLLSYRPDWGILWYVMAYGFLLLFWGPFTHFVVVPFVIRMRKRGDGPIARFISRHGSKTNLTIFLILVLVLGTFPVGPMTFEFQLPSGSESSGDVNPQLQCTKSEEEVHCHLSDSRGIDQLVVTSSDRTIETVEESPFEFDVRIDELESVRGQKQFTVELRDSDGQTLRRYVRVVETIPGE